MFYFFPNNFEPDRSFRSLNVLNIFEVTPVSPKDVDAPNLLLHETCGRKNNNLESSFESIIYNILLTDQRWTVDLARPVIKTELFPPDLEPIGQYRAGRRLNQEVNILQQLVHSLLNRNIIKKLVEI